jgi:hypothetical protein
MAIRILKWIGDNGDVLIPLSEETYNNGNMISQSGIFFKPITIEEITPLLGNPMGLLLTLTYSADQ